MAADFWTAKNKVSEPKGGSGRRGVRLSDRKRRQTELNQRIYWSHYGATLRGTLSFGSGHKHGPCERDQWVTPAHCCSVTHREGDGWGAGESARWDITPALHDAGPPRCQPCWNNHSTRLAWVSDSLTSVSANPVHTGVFSACVCLQFTLKPPPGPTLHNQLHLADKFIGK